MAKFKVLQSFNGLKEGKDFKAGEVIELTIKRADEIIKNIKDNFNIEGVLERDGGENGGNEQTEVTEQTNEEAAK